MTRFVALAGNPNSGKTTVFNRLTGLNQRVGNYPGVTVERRSGSMILEKESVAVIDLPGTYSLISRSRDEAVAFEVITGRSSERRPDLTIIVLDASNLDRNLYIALSILELGAPAIVALNMIDIARKLGNEPDPSRLEEALGVPVVPIVGKTGEGVGALRAAIQEALDNPPRPIPRQWRLTAPEEAAIHDVRRAISEASHERREGTDGEAIWLLTTLAVAEMGDTPESEDDPLVRARVELSRALALARESLREKARDFPAQVIRARYDIAVKITENAVTRRSTVTNTITDRIDAVLLHPVLGALIFLGVMALLFQSIFAWAEPLMSLIENAMGTTQDIVRAALPGGVLADLVADGIIGGVGNVLVFLPQIAILFGFLSILEDSGYLARAAFITDRMMARVGLHGRAFVPLLSGFACAVPAIMASRTVESKKDRLVTILVTPLMSCSARLPVYGTVISAFFSGRPALFGFISVGGLLLLAMYLLSVSTAVTAAFVLKRTILKSPTPPFVLELPPYRRPMLSSLTRRVYDRCLVFLRDAGTIILACSIVLWALLYFPRANDGASALGPTPPLETRADSTRVNTMSAQTERDDASTIDDEAKVRAQQLASSYAGRIGHIIEPLIAPLGFDWKIGIGLVASFAAREVLVSTLGLVYGVSAPADGENIPLREALRRERDPLTGRHVYSPLTGIALMVFFVLACQCMSTVAVVRRETGNWRWPAFMVTYMTTLAWVGAWVVYQGGKYLGFE